jgi:hypothetical protein
MVIFHSYVKLPEGNQQFQLGVCQTFGFLRPCGDLEIAQDEGFFNAQARLGDVRLGDGIKRGLF